MSSFFLKYYSKYKFDRISKDYSLVMDRSWNFFLTRVRTLDLHFQIIIKMFYCRVQQFTIEAILVNTFIVIIDVHTGCRYHHCSAVHIFPV